MVRTIHKGNVLIFNKKKNDWIIERKAKCNCGKTVPVCVIIPKDLSCNKKEKVKIVDIDFCIAPIVQALQEAGINMRGSCCGHGEREGDIHLQDGRVIKIFNKNHADKYFKER